MQATFALLFEESLDELFAPALLALGPLAHVAIPARHLPDHGNEPVPRVHRGRLRDVLRTCSRFSLRDAHKRRVENRVRAPVGDPAPWVRRGVEAAGWPTQEIAPLVKPRGAIEAGAPNAARRTVSPPGRTPRPPKRIS